MTTDQRPIDVEDLIRDLRAVDAPYQYEHDTADALELLLAEMRASREAKHWRELSNECLDEECDCGDVYAQEMRTWEAARAACEARGIR